MNPRIILAAGLAALALPALAQADPAPMGILAPAPKEDLVRKWRKRWCQEPFCLTDHPRPGRPPRRVNLLEQERSVDYQHDLYETK